MYHRMCSPINEHSFFLFGPRGTGKSTWLKSNYEGALYIDLLDSENYRRLLAKPERIENMIPKDRYEWIIIDEVQKNPALLNHVHRMIENRKQKFILTGSNSRKLKRQGANLLAGRARTLTFHPLTVSELKNDFDFYKSIQFGHLPESYTSQNPKLYLSSYVKTFLKEEVEQEGFVRKLDNFSRFLESASFSQAQPLSISSVSSDCGVDRKIVQSYFEILEDLLIGYRIPVFKKKAKRRVAAHSKFFFFDCGVYQSIRPRGPLDIPEEIDGPAWETLLFQEILATNNYLDLGYQIFTWRYEKVEVDLILYGEKGIFACEVKRSERLQDEDFKGLKNFKEDYPMAKCFLLYGGKTSYHDNGIDIMPLEEFIKNLIPILSSKRH